MIRWLILGCWASRGLAVGGLWGSFSSCHYRFHTSYILNHSHTIQLIWSCCWISQWWTYCTCKMLYGCTDTQEQDVLWCIYLHTIGACCCKMRTCRVALYMKLAPLNWIHFAGQFCYCSRASSSFHVLRRFCCSGRVGLHSKRNSLQDSSDKSGMDRWAELHSAAISYYLTFIK